MKTPLVSLVLLQLVASCLGGPFEWQNHPAGRAAPLAVPANGSTGFTRLEPALTRLAFTNRLAETSASRNRILDNGSGVALGDVDGDGFCDIYLCSLEGPNALYRNLGGWRFENITRTAGVACEGNLSTGAVLADLDGDGDLDLLVNGIGSGTRQFQNDGRGVFQELKSGLPSSFGATSMALADIEGDGDLDLYVANYRATTFKDTAANVRVELFQKGSQVIARPEERFMAVAAGSKGFNIFEKGEPDFLYLNDGGGTFTAASWTDGRFRDEDGASLTAPPREWGLSVAFRDINGDGAPDLYVCNDFSFSYDRVWLNDGAGRFRAFPRLGLRSMSMSSMGVDFADINRDGEDDFFVADMLSRSLPRRLTQRANVHREMMLLPFGVIDNRPEVMRNTLFLNRGDGSFAEIAQLSGLEASEWSWCPIFLDVDLDGYEDLLISNGNGHDVLDADTNAEVAAASRNSPAKREVLSQFPKLNTRNLAFRNGRDLTFTECGTAWGFDRDGISHGMAVGDLDNDGDLDLVVNELNAAAGVYRNNSPAPRLAVRLKGRRGNSRGIGARLRLEGGPVAQSQEIQSGGRYLSSDEAARTFAANAGAALTLEVRWRSGRTNRFEGLRANHLYELAEGNEAVANPAPESESSKPAALFENVSHLLRHLHREEPFDDFARQPSLPFKLSQGGPGLAWFDIDADGLDDLIVGSGRGGTLAIHRNFGATNGFKRITSEVFRQPAPRDQTSILGFRTPAGETVLLTGSSNHEDGLALGPSVRQYNFSRDQIDETLPGQVSSTGPLALADIDGDGDLDLFVGSQSVPGKYPNPANSRLFRDQGGRWLLDESHSKVLSNAGLVNGAIFTDYDNDGDPDLVLAVHWSSLRVLRNERGVFEDATHDTELDKYPGLWNGVSAGDFDGDGSMDLIASNFGRNTPYEAWRRFGPVQLYSADWNGDGTVELIEAISDREGRTRPTRALDVLGPLIPFIGDRFNRADAFAVATRDDILGDRKGAARQHSAQWFETTVFLNRNGRFQAVPLPIEAQFSPAFGIAVADFDGDGVEDVFLSQNFFQNQPEASRYDAGLGLLLKGSGDGQFTALSGDESGIWMYGEQRGGAAGDYDGDGRVDLAVGQNAGPTQLFHNRAAPAGLRVRLRGPPANPAAIGASLRALAADSAGPRRELRSGSGYWSQESAVLVFPMGTRRLEFRFPGAAPATATIPPGAREVELTPDGALSVLR